MEQTMQQKRDVTGLPTFSKLAVLALRSCGDAVTLTFADWERLYSFTVLPLDDPLRVSLQPYIDQYKQTLQRELQELSEDYDEDEERRVEICELLLLMS
jgi:hypothetical protein